MRDRRQQASAWFFKISGGGLTTDDDAEFKAWLSDDPENRRAFDQMASIWSAAPQTADLPEMIAVRADALEAMRAANAGRWARRIPASVWSAFGIAACLLLVVMGSMSYLAGRPEIYQTGVGERRVVMLEDGSRLSLDAATRVEVVYRRDARQLRLIAGRAKFDVERNPDRPFSVSAGGRTVIATGTAFSVELLDKQVRVVLYEGHVRVLAKSTDGRSPPVIVAAHKGVRAMSAEQALKPGTVLVASLDRPFATVASAEVQPSLAWEGGQLIFTDDSLEDAAERVNRYTDTPVTVEGRAATLPISGAFNAGDPAGFVDGASALYPLRVTRRGKGIVLSLARPAP